ncbi:MAG: hypothetical protein NVS4B8_00480 [Herpetosiphon sp.]
MRILIVVEAEILCLGENQSSRTIVSAKNNVVRLPHHLLRIVVVDSLDSTLSAILINAAGRTL